jgi:hypothetical protein
MGAHQMHLTVFTTPAYRRTVRDGSAKCIRFSLLRIDLGRGRLPVYVKAIRLPTPGILRAGLDPFTLDGHGNPVRGDKAMRDALGIEPVAAVLSRAFTAGGPLQVKAWSSLGNTPLNRGSVLWFAGALLHRVDEGGRIVSREPYRCIVVFKDRSVSAEDCRFTPGGSDQQWNIVIGDSDMSEKVQLAISGQTLLSGGVVIDPYKDKHAASEYPDLRHLICGAYPRMSLTSGEPAYEPDGQPAYRDFGLDQLLDDEGKRNAAIRGDIVVLDSVMRDEVANRNLTVTPPHLFAALKDKGYSQCAHREDLEECRRQEDRGHYWWNDVDTKLHIIFRRSPYPHHFLALRDDDPGVLYDCALGGWSNNGGSDPATIGADLAAAGFTEAILCDNGGDVVHVYVPPDHLGSSEALLPNGRFAIVPSSLGREQLAGLLVYPIDSGAQDRSIENSLVLVAPQDSGEQTLNISF